MISERDLQFVRQQINHPSSQLVEEVASESHETRRLPDTYVFVNRNGKLETPNGTRVENHINKSSKLGIIEAEGFDKIQEWSNKARGFSVWFSPTYPGKYPVTKIIIQEADTLKEGVKIVLNRAVVLDHDDNFLLSSASLLAGYKFTNTEVLRATPLFPDNDKFFCWFENLSKHIDQLQLIYKGEDLEIKQETYSKLNNLSRQRSTTNEFNTRYNTLYKMASSERMIGEYQSSCPPQINTAFESTFRNSHILNSLGVRKKICKCGICKEKVVATISGGKIYCPRETCEGNKGVTYRC